MKNRVAHLKGYGALLPAGVVALLAAPLSASTVSLSSGDYGGGLSLNAANVLIAASAFGGAGYTGSNTQSSYQVQSVTFLQMATSTSGGHTYGSVSNMIGGQTYGISIATTGGNQADVAGRFYYTTASTPTANSVHDTQAPTQPTSTNSTNLQTLLDTTDYSNSNSQPVVVTITGLTPNQQYVVDLLQSDLGYNARINLIAFNDGTQETAYLQHDSTHAADAFAYDTNDTIRANTSGIITASFTANPDGALVNGVVVSLVPEPATLGAMAVSGLGLLRRGRYRR